MKKKQKPKAGRPRIGQPISITLTEAQKDWIDSQIQEGETRTQVVRRIINEAMNKDTKWG